MDFELTSGQAVNLAVWGLSIGTLFFSFLGLRAEKDFFLVLGTMCCALGDFVFAYFLHDQQGLNNETFIAGFVAMGCVAVYAMGTQREPHPRRGGPRARALRAGRG